MSSPQPQAVRPESSTEPASSATEDDLLWLSALADGDADALDRGLAAWRQDPAARARWHSYHLIGDVLRSDELVQTASHDAAFLAQLRTRLADEPVPLAPAPLTPAATRQPPSGLRAWTARMVLPAAAAAGFLVVAAALVVTQQTEPEAAGGVGFAQSPASSGGQAFLASAPAPLPTAATRSLASSVPIDSTYLRNAELDRYLEAHSGAMGGSFVAPGGGKRLVDFASHVQPER
jgi:sigma-E factor negative regulatory protein RseA